MKIFTKILSNLILNIVMVSIVPKLIYRLSMILPKILGIFFSRYQKVYSMFGRAKELK